MTGDVLHRHFEGMETSVRWRRAEGAISYATALRSTGEFYWETGRLSWLDDEGTCVEL
jgi:hypothetical protein